MTRHWALGASHLCHPEPHVAGAPQGRLREGPRPGAQRSASGVRDAAHEEIGAGCFVTQDEKERAIDHELDLRR